MMVDDAVVVRGLVSRWVDEEPGLKIVASLRTGREAVDQIERINPDVVVLDIEMPDLDGISALPLLLAKKRDLVVIMASTLTRRNAEISLKALSLGAADYIPKPESNREVATLGELPPRPDREDPPARRAAQPQRRGRARVAAGARARLRRHVDRASRGRRAAPRLHAPRPADFKLRPFAPMPPRVLLIGSSTGGPQALTTLGRRARPGDRPRRRC